MNIWAKVGIAIVIVLSYVAVWEWGAAHGDSRTAIEWSGKLTELQNSVNQEKIDAAALAAAKQKSADAEALKTANERAAEALLVASNAATKVGQARAVNDALTAQLNKAKANDKQTTDLFATCLPPAVLTSLHGGFYKIPPGACH